MKVLWTPHAEACLRSIRADIEEDNPAAARRMIDRIIRKAMQLEMSPASGRRVPEYPEAQDLRQLMERPYRIFYRVRDDQVQIVSVMHYRRNLPATVKDLEKRL